MACANIARVAAATSSCRIRLSPIRKVVTPHLRQPRQIGGREKPAFADHQAVLRHPRRQAFGRCQRGFEGVEVAVVDADHLGFEFQRAVQFGLVMHFDQHIHAVAEGGGFEIGGQRVIDHRHDDQDAIAAPGAGFGHLIGIEQEVLAQCRKRRRGAGSGEEFGRALKGWRVGQDRETGGTTRLIGEGKSRGIEVGADQALGGARLLDLGDEAPLSGGDLAFSAPANPRGLSGKRASSAARLTRALAAATSSRL